jgi:hypothetical protein
VSKQYKRKIERNGGKNMLYKKLGIFMIMLVLCSGLVTALSVPSRNLESKNQDKTPPIGSMDSRPVCDFQWVPFGDIYVGDTITFTSSSWDPDGPLTNCAWNFNYPFWSDTHFGEYTTTFVYNNAGTYVVSLWVAGDQYYSGDPTDQGQKEHTLIIKPKPTCFPAGTKITMADGSYKNIENIKRGDRIMSYNIMSGRISAWTVYFIPHEPIKPVYEVNNGLLSLSEEHPLYVKKTDGKIGWAAIIPNKSFVRLKGDGSTLEVGDQLFTSNREWIKVTNITYSSKPVQVYNIWSFSGTQNFFANDILVLEEHSTVPYLIKYYYERFLDRYPNAFPILRHLLG